MRLPLEFGELPGSEVTEASGTTRLTADDIKALVAGLQDITATLAAADAADKAKV